MFLATLQIGTKQVRGTVHNGLENYFRERVSVACPGEINLSLIYAEFPRFLGFLDTYFGLFTFW